MKTRLLFQTVCVCSLIFSCAEAPEYTPRPQQPVTSSTSPNQSATKTPTSDAQKAGENKGAATMTPDTPTAAPTPTPTPTPTPSATPANPSAGVVATGRTLVMQNCAAACHITGGTPINAKDELTLAAGKGIAAHANRDPPIITFFDQPAAGAPATNFSHILAYLKSVQTPVMGPLP